MNDEQRLLEILDRLAEAEAGDAPSAEDPAGFWTRLLESVRVKVSGAPPNKIEITGGAEF